MVHKSLDRDLSVSKNNQSCNSFIFVDEVKNLNGKNSASFSNVIPTKGSLLSNLQCAGDMKSSAKVLRKSDVTECVNTKRKAMERGTIVNYRHTIFVLYCENLPVWLLSLRNQFCDKILFPQFETFQRLVEHVRQFEDGMFFEQVICSLEQSKLIFNEKRVSASTSASFMLISGTLNFFRDNLPTFIDHEAIFIHDSHKKIRKIPPFTPPIRRIKHVQFGRASKFESIYAVVNLEISLSQSKLKRDIASFLDYSQRILKPCDADTPFVTNQFDLLHPNSVYEDILMTSDFSKSGFGIRKLTVQEIGSIFGISTRLQEFLIQKMPFNFVPVQILNGLLGCVLEPIQNYPKKQKTEILPAPVIYPPSAPTFLPDLNRTLPNDWAKVDGVCQHAAKHDDAEVDFKKWDLRITTLFPNAISLIPALRKCLLRRQFRKLYLEFKQHICQKFGKDLCASWFRRRASTYWKQYYKQLKGVISPQHYVKLLNPLLPWMSTLFYVGN